ncbi:MAG: hypothetical protein C0598_04055 [Marinilabiliales bacterium]|nr:MAG: hypothetical protein C0598_04055 [Marinilabiliales bacterium]
MANYDNDITISKSILEMLTVANEFCHYLDTCEKKSKKGVLDFVNRICPLLYLKGSLLPDIEVEDPDANERFVTAENWETIFTMLRDKFMKDDEFWLIDPQHVNEDEPLKASLAENLSDIYQDMKDFILLYQKNTFVARQNAISECKLLFESHWGYRIANIMPRLHHLLYEKQIDDTATESPFGLI